MPAAVGLDWMGQNLKVETKWGTLEPMIPPNPNVKARGIIKCQAHLLRTIAKQWGAGQPARLIILKARQLGCSTVVGGFQFSLVRSSPNKHAFVCAHDSDSSDTLFRMVKNFNKNMPRRRGDKGGRVAQANKKELVWDNDSSYRVQTAGNINLGRGSRFQYLHCSEVAFWPNDRSSLTSVRQCVSDNVETLVVLESTANGAKGVFYNEWNKWTEHQRKKPGRLDGYIPIFLSWLDNPEEYSTPVPDGYDWDDVDPEVAKLEPLIKSFGGTPEQLYWRRKKIAEALHHDADMFDQEYPTTPEQAFLHTGRPAIPQIIIGQHRRTIKAARRAKLEWSNDRKNRARIVYDASFASNYWEIWEEPIERNDYAVGGDVAEGGLSDIKDKKSQPDFSAIAVLNRTELSTAAQWHGRIDADLLGDEMLKVAYFYNQAWMSPEANAVGQATLLHIKRASYPRLYNREQQEDRDNPEITQYLGWKTTNANRDDMIDEWKAACRPDFSRSFEGSIKCYSAKLLREEETFIYTDSGKREHAPGEFDDVLFAWFVALQMHLRNPRARSPLTKNYKNRGPTGVDQLGGRDHDAQRILAGRFRRKLLVK